VALENLCDWGFLVTLGDCHHLDGLEVVVSVVKHTRRLCGAPKICEGYRAHPMGAAKSNTSRACY
jgi:hypothetical protein